MQLEDLDFEQEQRRQALVAAINEERAKQRRAPRRSLCTISDIGELERILGALNADHGLLVSTERPLAPQFSGVGVRS